MEHYDGISGVLVLIAGHASDTKSQSGFHCHIFFNESTFRSEI